MMQVRWLKNRKLLVGASIGAIAITVALLVYRPSWTGFGSDSTKTTERDGAGNVIKIVEVEQSGKTLWDWLSVLGVPLSLAILGFWFQQQQKKQSDEQLKTERTIAENNQREEVLQTYFDRISLLLVDKNLIAIASRVETNPDFNHEGVIDPEKELLNASMDVVRARTLSILRRLNKDIEGKSSIIRFLVEADVVNKLKLNLNTADLSGANLVGTNFNGADIRGIDFTNGNLAFIKCMGSKLSWTKFDRSNMLCADLRGAYLYNAGFQKANLQGALFNGADITDAFFYDANLIDADFSNVFCWTEEQLSLAKLCRTMLPEGCNLDPDRDCLELDESMMELDEDLYQS